MKRSDIPYLDDLRAFETVARLGSVRAAAGELALTHGAVSRRVTKLAADLNLRLLEVEGRGLRLTPDGAVLAAATGKAFGLITGALADIRSASTPVPIILSCERSLAMRWLIPRLSGFQDRYPDVEVHLSTGGGAFDFARDRVTLAIRRLDFPVDPAWTVIRLMPERVGPVMVPGLCERFAAGDYVALGSRTRPGAWEGWLNTHPQAQRPRSIRLLDHHFLMTEAALGGLGVALAPQAITADDVANGRLESPFGFDPDGTDYGLIHPKAGIASAHLAALRDWIIAQSEVLQTG
ncbi:MAG: LysR family transcriptional regulator [Cypionkella sp.]|uniref:LysR family transcriptional regulator n=1 Tax=Cypionkella sp. TaxID=2811411 RepID=UPI002AB917A3|nr:LysR family transcriptional regulator [Cypionkella sp.]MDZ4309627.1 LysR family transcriptional regulator [Cypionkella sp.]